MNTTTGGDVESVSRHYKFHRIFIKIYLVGELVGALDYMQAKLGIKFHLGHMLVFLYLFLYGSNILKPKGLLSSSFYLYPAKGRT